MALIKVSVQIDASVDRVWKIVSDIDNEPKFWKGTKDTRNISKEGNIIKREITIAFRDQRCLQEVELHPKDKIEARFTKGIINGIKTINLSPDDGKTTLEAIWDIKLSGVMSMFTGMLKNHIKSGTEQALQNIKEAAEK